MTELNPGPERTRQPIPALEDSQCSADLRRIDMFGDLAEEHLQWILAHAECLHLEPGDPLWIAGRPADAMFVVLTGQIQVMFEVSGQQVRLTSDKWGGVIGVLPYSRMTEYQGKTAAIRPSRVLQIRREHFSEMLYEIPELGYRLVALMSDRVREGTRFEQRREKMMALGKLSAGLAHELNNPAAAVARAAADLAEGLERSNDRAARLASLDIDGDLVARLISLREVECPTRPLTTLERGEKEDELADWLEDHGMEDGYLLAESFVAAGITADKLAGAADGFPDESLPDALGWVETGLRARQLLDEVGTAARRISELVAAVKSYSHMDQAPEKAFADLHRGIRETVVMLGHALKKKSIHVEKHFGDGLPEVPIFGSEMNQVWTNLIDNAIDALPEGGTIRIETEHDTCSAFVRFIDNGPGIPEDVQQRIFEPFFTTKAAGEGTGLGLDISHRIVLQHDGEIQLESEPGKTAFTVRLPLTDRAEGEGFDGGASSIS
ncbi:MAG: ATP-binding protein [Acidobacteriota bacterium]